MHVSQLWGGTHQQQHVISRHHNFIQSAKSRLKEFLSGNVYVNAASCVCVCSRVHDKGGWVYKNVNKLQSIRFHHVEFLISFSKRRFVAIRYTWRTEPCFIASGVPRGGGLGVFKPSPPRNSEGPPKSCQTQPDCEKLSKIAEFRTPTPQDVRKKGSKILKLPRFAFVLHLQWQINWLSS